MTDLTNCNTSDLMVDIDQICKDIRLCLEQNIQPQPMMFLPQGMTIEQFLKDKDYRLKLENFIFDKTKEIFLQIAREKIPKAIEITHEELMSDLRTKLIAMSDVAYCVTDVIRNNICRCYTITPVAADFNPKKYVFPEIPFNEFIDSPIDHLLKLINSSTVYIKSNKMTWRLTIEPDFYHFYHKQLCPFTLPDETVFQYKETSYKIVRIADHWYIEQADGRIVSGKELYSPYPLTFKQIEELMS